MAIILFCILSVSPFYEANFTALPIRSISIFSNPAGTGYQPGAEYFFTYHPDMIRTAVSLGNLGIGMTKIDSITYYEIGLGVRLPGVLSFGYAHQFDLKDYGISSHIIGFICRPNQYASLGYKTTLGERNHMFGGIGIRPYQEYVTLSFDLEYEGIDSIFTFYYGGMIQPIKGAKINIQADKDFNWNAGLELSSGNMKLAGAYSSIDKKFSGGIILSVQSYKTFLPAREKMARLNLKGNYPELKQKSFFGIPLRLIPGFTKLLSDLKSLINRDDIKAVLVELKDHNLGPAQREELENVLLEIKNSQKKVVFFADSYNGILTYALASIGDEIILSPGGSVVIPGIASRSVYVKGSLEKLGLEADIVAIGKYKSAKEILSRTDMSEADRVQTAKYLDDIYYPVLDNIAKNCNRAREDIEELVNEIGYFNSDDAKSLGLIDTTMYWFELKDYLNKKYGKMAIVDFEDIINEKIVNETWGNRKPRIALVIAEGFIVSGQGNPNFFVSSLIGGNRYAEIFENISKDKSIKAVVFRINSGGGDALASEEIAYALKRCAKQKPVIVTMGDVAGSGGYYIACLADKIYADNRTVTGSIGVLSVNLITKGLYDKLGITWDYVKRGEHSDAFWGLRHLTDEELASVERETRWWYDRFTSCVAEGRKMTQDKVGSLGEGRIYSGKYASEVNLVDETGGYLEALNAARQSAGIKGDVEIVVYPSRLSFSFLNNNDVQKDGFMYLMPEIEIK